MKKSCIKNRNSCVFRGPEAPGNHGFGDVMLCHVIWVISVGDCTPEF